VRRQARQKNSWGRCFFAKPVVLAHSLLTTLKAVSYNTVFFLKGEKMTSVYPKVKNMVELLKVL